MAADDAAIRVRGLRVAYGSHVALDGVDLTVERGTVLGWVGPNGAGKTTTVRALLGLQAPFQGEVRVAGLDPRREPVAVKARVGYVPEGATLFDSLTVAEHLLLVGRLRGLDDDVVVARCDPMLEALELRGRLGSRVGSLSKGMRQKLMLAAALMDDPEVLLLDEPLSGLDAASALLVKEVLRRLADRGRAVLYASHVLDVVERVCDRVAILDRGRVVAEGTMAELAARRGETSLERILVSLTEGEDAGALAERLLAPLAGAGDAPERGAPAR